MVRSVLGFVSGFALLASACGGGSDGGTFTTSVDSTKAVDKLTPAENTQLCKDGEVWAKDFEKTFTPKLCKLAGLAAKTKAECDTAVMACLNEPSDSSSSKDMCEPFKDCTATVGEVQKCFNDTITMLGAYLDKFPTCTQIGDPTATIPVTQPTQPASCKAIAKTCPEVADFGGSLAAK